jgi:hypothetical protein
MDYRGGIIPPDPLIEAWAGEPGDSSDGVAAVELAGTGLAVARMPLCTLRNPRVRVCRDPAPQAGAGRGLARARGVAARAAED